MMPEQSSTNTLQLYGAIRDSRGITPTEKLVLYAVAAHAPRCFAAYDRLAEETGLHRDTLKRTLKALSRSRRLIVTPRQRANGSTSSNELTVLVGAGQVAEDPPWDPLPPWDPRSRVPPPGDLGSPHPGIVDPPPEVTLRGNPSEVTKRQRTKGTRCPPDWKPDETLTAFARDHGVTDVDRVVAEFVDYWISVSGRNATKLDWGATFRNRVRDLASRTSRSTAYRGAPIGRLKQPMVGQQSWMLLPSERPKE